jgi:hypothetical protein
MRFKSTRGASLMPHYFPRLSWQGGGLCLAALHAVERVRRPPSPRAQMGPGLLFPGWSRALAKVGAASCAHVRGARSPGPPLPHCLPHLGGFPQIF